MKIQSMWVGNEISKIERLSMQSFLSNGMDYTLYVYNDVNNVPDGVKIDDANKILHESEVTTYKKGPGKGSYAGFADYFRWALMHKVGGAWIDTDVICIKNFSVSKNKVAGEMVTEGNFWASTQFLHFDTKNKLMEDLFLHCKSMDCGDIEWGDIGPKLINDKIKEANLESYILPANNINANPWWKWKDILDPEKKASLMELSEKQDVFCMHLWNEMWRRDGIDKNSEPPSGSFLEHLFERYLG